MRLSDTLEFALRALGGHRSRTWLIVLAVGLGAAAVVLLSALGEGARAYVENAFTQLGTHLLIVFPGRNETTGGPPPLLGESARDLTLDDALALTRARGVARLAPISVGSAPVSAGSLEREVNVIGTTADFLGIRRLTMGEGRFLPAGDPSRGHGVVVLGRTLAKALFGHRQAVGEWVRIGQRRFRVTGILGNSGQSLGETLDDLAIIPVATAQALFDSPGLFRILVEARDRDALPGAQAAIKEIVRARHEGEDDVTVITQDAMLATFDKILKALTLAVAGIGAISLAVAGVLIMNVMLVSVAQRTGEVGLLKALGASQGQVVALFLAEALLLAGAGTLAGLGLAFGAVAVDQRRPERLPARGPPVGAAGRDRGLPGGRAGIRPGPGPACGPPGPGAGPVRSLSMRTADFVAFTLGSLNARRGRSLLTLLGIAIGVAAVVLLTAIGEGVHRFVLAEFTQFGSNLIGIAPGKTATFGMSGGVVSNVRPLALADARALAKLPGVTAVAAHGPGQCPGGGEHQRGVAHPPLHGPGGRRRCAPGVADAPHHRALPAGRRGGCAGLRRSSALPSSASCSGPPRRWGRAFVSAANPIASSG